MTGSHLADGVVKVRLSGENIGDVADLIIACPGLELIEQASGYPNRTDPGERIYLTMRRASNE